MWIRFKNDVLINLEHVLSITHSGIGHKLIFLGMAGYATTLGFKDQAEVDFVLDKVKLALQNQTTDITEIDATPTT